MQFIQTRAYERKRKCKRKLARECKRARVKRKILCARVDTSPQSGLQRRAVHRGEAERRTIV